MLHVFVLLALLPLQDTLDRVEQSRVNGRPKEGIELLEQVRRQSPEVFRRNNLLYLRSVLCEEAGLRVEAREGFEALLETDFPLPDSVLLHLVSASDDLSVSGRRRYYEGFLTRFPAHPRWSEIASDFADLLADNEQSDDALAWYRKIVATRKGFARDAALKLARLLLVELQRPGARDEALSLLTRIIAEGDRDEATFGAATELRRLEVLEALTEPELYRRALIFLNARKAAIARVYLGRLLGQYPKSPGQAEYRYLVGQILSTEGKRSEAVLAYKDAYRGFPTSEWGIASEYQAGILHLGFQEYPEAAAAFEEIVKNRALSSYFDRAVVSLSETQVWMGDRAAALETLREALPETKDPSQLHYCIARLNLEDGKYQPALESLARIVHLTSDQLPPGVTREEVLYWKGVCEEQLGLGQESLQSFKEAIRGRPNYFSQLARGRLSAETAEETLRAATQVQSEAWSGRVIPPRHILFAAGESPAALPPAENLQRLQELLFLRLFDEAYPELKRPDAIRLFSQKSDYLFQVAQVAERGGLYRQSLDTAEELRELLFGHTSPDFYPEPIRRLLYPLHYWDLVSQYGSRYGVDPYLLLALIRQESSFQADAVSRASASGLMQLMPATARELAGRLKIRFQMRLLYEPETSIQLGTLYFKQLLDNFDGSFEKTLAAYNGGGSNVRRWEKKVTSQDPAVFVANIGFRETKLYVARVLGNYWTYRRLYGEKN